MTDLIKRLLAEETDLTDCAADHIEQTEAKLTKAVEALRFLIEATTVPEANTCITRALSDARAVLAELEDDK